MLPFSSHHSLPVDAMEDGKVALTAESKTRGSGELGELGGNGGRDELELGPHLHPDEARTWPEMVHMQPR